VPPEFQELQSVYSTVRKELRIERAALDYKGQTAGAACEEIRVLLMKQPRRRRTPEEREAIAASQEGLCAMCSEKLERFELDHIRPLSDGGSDEANNLQALCLTCHAQKSQSERLCGLSHSPLYSDLAESVLEGLFDAPKPQQLVWGSTSGQACWGLDVIGCRSNAIRHNQSPIPVACVFDRILPGFVYDADFYFIDNKQPLDEASLRRMCPYMGPAWYPRETARFLVEVEVATPDDFEASFRASEHAPHDALRGVYERIHELVKKSVWDEPEATQRLYKAMVLSMQGSWLKRSSVKWKVTRSTSMEDRLGPVQRVKELDDGSMLLMSSTERLTNSTMYLVGLMTLHTEHLLVAKLQRFLRRTPRAPPVACVVDCLYYAQKDLKRSEAQEAVTELRWPDGSPIFRIVKVDNDNQEPRPRPLTVHEVLPRRSKWRCYAQDVLDAPEGIPEKDAETMFDFGAWSIERRFALRTDWRVRREGHGLGRGPEDTQQDIAVEDLVMNGGGMVRGRGGTGKSTVLRRLKEALEARGEEVHVIAFTHVAAGNIDGGTILHELHSNIRKKQVCLLVDEISMVSRKMWAQLARYRFTGSKFFLFGDPVQFGAIQDQGKGQIDFDHNFFWRLCNGLQLHLNKFRRGGDAGHFEFVGSLYPPHSPSLQEALDSARESYPCDGRPMGTMLVVSHAARLQHNEEMNVRLAPPDAQLIKAPEAAVAGANQPQDMRVWWRGPSRP
jgi:5-methylcytosine-specific restriction protein A